MSQDDVEALNRIAVQIRFYEEQLQSLQNQLQLLQSTIQNLDSISFTIENLEGVEAGQEVLLPIGKVAQIRAKIVDPKHVILNVGANIFVEQESTEANGIVKERIEEIKKIQENVQNNMQQIVMQMEQLRPRFSELYQKLQGQPPQP